MWIFTLSKVFIEFNKNSIYHLLKISRYHEPIFFVKRHTVQMSMHDAFLFSRQKESMHCFFFSFFFSNLLILFVANRAKSMKLNSRFSVGMKPCSRVYAIYLFIHYFKSIIVLNTNILIQID